MKANDFILALQEKVVDGNLTNYKGMVENTKESNDVYWKDIIPFYKALNSNEKDVFMKLIRLVEVNTVSHILGIIDGSSLLVNKDEVFELTFDGEVISGDLQDQFLELEGY